MGRLIFDSNIVQIITKIFPQFIQLCCLTNVFIAAKIVATIFLCFFKHWTWLDRISLFLFEFLTTQRNWGFVLIRIFNYKRKRILDVVEMYLVINFILHLILCIFFCANDEIALAQKPCAILSKCSMSFCLISEIIHPR